jgi:3-oxoacyl-[acyl-carrier-protein] synthase-3
MTQLQNRRIVLTGMGHFFPDTVLDNQFFDELNIGSAAQWIDERVGIKERRSVMAREDIIKLRHGQTTRAELVQSGRIMTIASMVEAPWRQAKQRALAARPAGNPGDVTIDTAICGTSVPDWDIPANACSVAGRLGLDVAAFDINSACSTFAVNLHAARALLLSGSSNAVGIFNAERYTTRVDYTDRSSCVLFGDSASAAILEAEPRTASPGLSGLELIDTIVHSDPTGYEHVRLPEGGYFSQNGQAVQKFAVTKTVHVTLEILAKNGLDKADISYFIGHQANFRMLDYACQKNGIGPDRHLFNVDVRGNQGATGASTVLSTHWDKYKSGDIIVVAVVGSGLTWGAALFRKI